MNFTQEQISELMLNIANSENGTNLLMQMTLNAFMKSERYLQHQENPDTYKNVIEKEKHVVLARKWFSPSMLQDCKAAGILLEKLKIKKEQMESF